MRVGFTMVAALLFVGAAGAVRAEGGPGLQSRLSATLAGFHDRYEFPGATAAIAWPDGTLVTAATGFADVESGRAMTPETPMLAASIGKTFVAATVLALESDGRVSQADLLADHLGDRAWFGKLPNAETMTIGHLLRHQSGLPDHVHLPAFQAAVRARVAAGARAFAPEELLGFVLGRAPLFPAGAGWAYSDTGYILLGMAIEDVTGRSYHASLRDMFLDPLGLVHTVPSDRPDLPGLAVGYTSSDNPFGLRERTADPQGRLVWDPAVEWTGGGLASTARDLASWGHALFGGEAMTVPYLDRLLDGVAVAPETPDIQYGAGVAIYTGTPRGPVYGHGGWIPGYVSSLRHYADHGVTVAFQVNTDAADLGGDSDLVPELEAALADLALEAER